MTSIITMSIHGIISSRRAGFWKISG